MSTGRRHGLWPNQYKTVFAFSLPLSFSVFLVQMTYLHCVVHAAAGATSGIGVETARALALRGVHVVMGIRNMTAGGEIKETILRYNPIAKIDMMELDLSSMESVRTFASQFNSRGLPLNILVYVTADTSLLARVICT